MIDLSYQVTVHVSDDPAVGEAHAQDEHPRPRRDCRACVEAWQETAYDTVRPVVPYVPIKWGY